MLSSRHRISAAYFLYFVTLGLYLPYFPAYLRGRGLSPVDIGWLLAMGPLARGVLPPLFGLLADRFKGPHFWGVVTAWGMAAGMVCVLAGEGFAMLLLGVAIYYLSNSATIPLLDATALSYLARFPGRFGTLRLWGSIGFIVTSFGLGLLFPALPMTLIAAGLVASHVVFAAYVTAAPVEEAAPQRPAPGELRALLASAPLLALMLGLFLNRVASASFVGFYTLYVQDLGLPGDVVAWTWGIAVTVEVFVMLIVDRLIDRFGAGKVLTAGFLLEALRFGAYAYVNSRPWLLVLAPGHGIAFTLGYVATVRRALEIVPARLRATGQGLAAAATGFGQTVGLVLAGYAQARYGNQGMYLAAGAVGLTGALVAARASAPLRPARG